MVESQRPAIKCCVYFLCFLSFLSLSLSAHAYVLTESTLRVPIRWSNSNFQINFDTSSNDNDPSRNIFCRNIDPRYCTQKASDEINEVLSYWNQTSPVPILSNSFSANRLSFSTDPRFFSPGVVAITLLSYNPGNGIINNGQIYINQQTNPGFCFTKLKSAEGCVYFGDVVAHELGHFAGLAHSEVRESTMLYTSFRGQHTLHSDDVSGLRSIYTSTSYGKIRGRVLGGHRVPVFGAHVQAISTRLGDVAASAITQENGEFVIEGLDLDQSYYLYTEPLRKLDSLPDAYRSAQTNFCPGSYVGSFFESCASQTRGQPQAIRVSSSQSDIDVGVVSIRCQVRVSPTYLDSKLRTGSGLYEFDAHSSKAVTSFVGFYPSTTVISNSDPDESIQDVIKLDLSMLGDLPASSRLVIKLMSSAIGSAIDFSVTINGPTGTVKDPDRSAVNPDVTKNFPPPNKESMTQKPIFQRQLNYTLSSVGAQNLVEIALSPRTLDPYEHIMAIPERSLFTIKDKPYLVIFEIHRGLDVLYQDIGGNLSDNSTCIDAPFTFAVKANKVSSSAIAGQEEDSGTQQVAAASCGTIEPPNSKGGPGIFSFLIGMILLIFIPKKIRSNS